MKLTITIEVDTDESRVVDIIDALTNTPKVMTATAQPAQAELPLETKPEPTPESVPENVTPIKKKKRAKKKMSKKAAAPAPEAPVVEKREVIAKMQEVAARGQKEAIQSLLAEMGASRLSDLDPSTYAGFIEKMNELPDA